MSSGRSPLFPAVSMARFCAFSVASMLRSLNSMGSATSAMPVL